MRMPFASTVRCLIAVIACSLASAISLPAQIDQHVSIRIDGRRREWMHDDGRVRDLDDRGAWHDVTGNEALAPEDGREIEVAQLRPVNGSRAGARRAGRSAIGLGRGDDARLGAHRGGAHAIGHDLHARLAESRALAVNRLVPSMEVADELGERGFVEHPRRHRHLDLVDLALVADVGRAREPGLRGIDAVGAELRAPALLQLAKALHHARGIERARLDVHRFIYMEEVGRGRAERGPQRAEPAERDDDALSAQLARIHAGVHGTGATVGEDHAVARIVALLHRGLPDQVRHLVLDHADGAGGGLDEAEAEPRGDRLQARPRAVLIEPQPTAEEVAGIEIAEHEIGVGHRRLRAAAPVARGTGLGSGRDRPNADRAAHVVDPDDRAAAAPDRADVDAWDEVFVLVDDALVARHRLAVPDEADVE